MTEQTPSTSKSSIPGLAIAVSSVVAILAALLWPFGEQEEGATTSPVAPSSSPAPAPEPTEEPEEETLTEYVLPPVCENVILANEMLVVVAQDTYSKALDAVIDKDVKGMKKATEGLEAYRQLLTEVTKTYEADREECMGTKSDSELLKEKAEQLLEDE